MLSLQCGQVPPCAVCSLSSVDPQNRQRMAEAWMCSRQNGHARVVRCVLTRTHCRDSRPHRRTGSRICTRHRPTNTARRTPLLRPAWPEWCRVVQSPAHAAAAPAHAPRQMVPPDTAKRTSPSRGDSARQRLEDLSVPRVARARIAASCATALEAHSRQGCGRDRDLLVSVASCASTLLRG